MAHVPSEAMRGFFEGFLKAENFVKETKGQVYAGSSWNACILGLRECMPFLGMNFTTPKPSPL